MTNHDTLRDLVDAYYLGGLDRDERQMVESHLRTCDGCQHRAREAQALAEGLARTLEPVRPSAALRERVLARTLATPQEGTAQRRASSEGRPRRSARAWHRSDWLAAAATIAAVVTGALATNYRQQVQQLDSELQTLHQQVSDQQQRIATLQAAAQNLRQTTAILTAADLSRVDLGGLAPAPVASGRVFWSAAHGLVFSATNLPPLPPGQVYQLWLVAEQPHSAGVVTPDAGGNLNVVTTGRVPAQPKAFAVTIEPEGGRPAPSGPMFLLGAL